MANNDKMWALMVYLSANQWPKKTTIKDTFDDTFWEYILDESVKCGINTILLDVGNGVEYGSHPEIADENAWTRRRVRKEVARCRDMGIKIIPKLNFATTHGYWMGEYRYKTSTNEYYRFANDMIKETYELFDHPEYIHIGLDEEDARHCGGAQLAVYRQKELYWHDTRFLIDCVADTGARPWIWSCPLFRHTEEYQKHIDAEEVLISPWQYFSLYEETWTRIDSDQELIDYYGRSPYKEMNLTYVEEDPYCVMYREKALPLMKDGYDYVPCVSVYNHCDYNTPDTFRYYKENAPDNQVLGMLTAPWARTIWDFKDRFDESFRFFKEAKEKYYG